MEQSSLFRQKSLDRISSPEQLNDYLRVTTIRFDDSEIARSVEAGMTVSIGESTATISSVGLGEDGRLFALAQTSLADGSYPVRVVYKTTQVRRLLFN